MTEYNLGTLETIQGVFTFKMYHSDATLNVPSRIPIVSVGNMTERLDYLLGISEIQNLSVAVREEYTGYAEGFWNKVLNETIYDEDVQLKVELDSNIIFWGIIHRESTTFDERYLSGSDHLRTGVLVFVSMMYKLKEVPVTELTTEVLTHDVIGTYNTNPYAFIKVKDVIASMVAMVYGQTFSTNDVIIRNDADIQYTHSGSQYGFEDIYMISNPIGYFNVASDRAWENRFATCFDLLQQLVKNFGFVARWVYESGRHKIELVTRGRSYGTYLDFHNREIESSVSTLYPLQPRNIRCSIQVGSGDGYTAQHWWVDGKSGGDLRLYDDPDPDLGEPPKFAEIHFDVGMEFILSWDNENAIAEDVFINTTGSTFERITSIRYYDYEASSYVDETFGTLALATYYYRRFSPNRRVITRTYGKVSADESSVESLLNLKLLKATQINDGFGAQNFYAQEIEMNFESDNVKIEWAQE